MSLRKDIKNAPDMATLQALYQGAYTDITTLTAAIEQLKIDQDTISNQLSAKKQELKDIGGNGDIEDLFIKRIGQLKLSEIQ